MRFTPTNALAATACTVALLGAVGCSADESPDATSSSGGSTGTWEPDMAAQLVGPGCSDYAEQVPEGAGSVAGMAQDPVSVAAGNNPLLTTLTAAVSGDLNADVDLVDTLNGDEFTVFAPVDKAFAELPTSTVAALKLPKNAEMLTTVLTYHVLPGQLSPDAIVGSHKTVEGESLKVTGTGDDLMVNDAHVICGGVQTANATVYLIDSVMMPPTM